MSVPGATVRSVLLVSLASGFLAACLALAAIDLVSWRRTASLRSGQPSFTKSSPRGRLRSSSATFLAALGGTLALAWGVGALAARRLEATPFLLAGAFVVATGLTSRVTGIDVDGAGLRIRYAAKRSHFVPWASLRSLYPPRTPLGSWRVDSGSNSVSLMPSDLFGHERVLDVAVILAALAFDGHAWRRRAGQREAAPT